MRKLVGMYVLMLMWNLLRILVFLMLLFLPGGLLVYLFLIAEWFGRRTIPS